KDCAEFNELMGLTIDFSNFIKHHLKKDKITKADLEGLVFKLLKGTCKSSIELEYHLEQRYLAFSKQLDWPNLEGDRCPYDLSKPVPLQDMSLRLWSSTKVFYDKDVALGISHCGPKRQLFYRSRNVAKSWHDVFSHLPILGVVRLSIDNQFRYGYLKEIVVRRADLKEYSFSEANFSRLHFNDIKDLFLLYVQRKIHNLTGEEILHLFSDGTLKDVRDNMNDMLHNFKLGYNDVMPKRKWLEKDQERTTEMLKLIDDLLLERWIIMNGLQTTNTDYLAFQNRRDLPNDTPLVRVYVLRITQLIAGIEDSHHGAGDTKHNPPKLLRLLSKEVCFVSHGD
ncbi:hypothetical protein Tco_1048281, partial [Tanacetum coccineum]